MRVAHCGVSLSAQIKPLKPTAEEALRGVVEVIAFTYWCPKPDCRKKLYFKSEITKEGIGPMQRVRPDERAAFAARLKEPKESHWVWSWDRKTYQQVKWTVR